MWVGTCRGSVADLSRFALHGPKKEPPAPAQSDSQSNAWPCSLEDRLPHEGASLGLGLPVVVRHKLLVDGAVDELALRVLCSPCRRHPGGPPFTQREVLQLDAYRVHCLASSSLRAVSYCSGAMLPGIF